MNEILLKLICQPLPSFPAILAYFLCDFDFVCGGEEVRKPRKEEKKGGWEKGPAVVRNE